jgi:hypothetical protein
MPQTRRDTKVEKDAKLAENATVVGKANSQRKSKVKKPS